MKIESVEPKPSIGTHLSKSPRASGKGGEFHQVLRETMSQESMQPVAKVSPSMPLKMPVTMNCEQVALERVEQSLNNLESYQAMLGDPKVNMREMEPFVGQLKQDAGQLGQLSEQFRDDEGIKPIMNDVVDVISKEIGRYERGDYID